MCGRRFSTQHPSPTRKSVRSVPPAREAAGRYGRLHTTVEALRSRGHDVTHLREEGLHKLPDAQILDKARNELRTVIAFDLDFGDLLAAGGQSGPSVVILRLSDQTPRSVNARLAAALEQCEAELSAGAVVIVEEARYRLRRLPIKPP